MQILRLVRVIALFPVLTACATVDFKVMEADLCPVPTQQLTEQCPLAQSLQPGATYDDLVALAIEDSANLRRCGEQAKFLRNAVELCNASIERHNAKIREINAKVKEAR
jgi:hypothetical protein